MKLASLLPVQSLFFRHWHTDDSEVGVVVAKAQFVIRDDGSLSTNKSPAPIEMVDKFVDAPGMSPLQLEQEIAPGKVATDLLINAVAMAPGGRAAPDWPVTVSIPDKLHYGFRVRGPSRWTRGMMGWRLSDPEAVTEVPITYALAYGGTAQGDPEARNPPVFEHNPAGLGFATVETLKGKTAFAAPQIGELAEFMAAAPDKEMTVHGFGPIAKAWLPRRHAAGTFDDDWRATRHPRMPKDYGLRFWNCAPLPLQIEPMLTGDEVITIEGVTIDPKGRRIELPGVQLSLAATGPGAAERFQMPLDTVTIDLTDADPLRHTATLLWRTIVPQSERFNAGDIQSLRIGT